VFIKLCHSKLKIILSCQRWLASMFFNALLDASLRWHDRMIFSLLWHSLRNTLVKNAFKIHQ
jgi:hypothetical protein